jgi:pyruvate dehydrogenase E1 component
MKPESGHPTPDPLLNPQDIDPEETREWRESLEAVARVSGSERALYLLEALSDQARELGLTSSALPYSAYRNTITLENQGAYPGDEAIEQRLLAILRWNALVMVMRANQRHPVLGGHIASFASAAEIFETGFNHFFRGPGHPGGADLLYLQPHSAPGVYARAFLEGRLSEAELDLFRQEVSGGQARGLSSYPHPWLMPDFWQVPTGSMGLGPISAVYQARFMRYLHHRDIIDAGDRHVWGVFGDGEMDEPESIAGLTLAAREGLNNLTFIVNCNLQRLDGPVRGNGQIIPELEALFRGAGWNVVKVLWGSDWDSLFARDTNHALLRRFAATVDGKYQTLGAKDGAYNLANFFGGDPEVAALVSHMSDEQIDALTRGGHDLRKLFAAFQAAREFSSGPTVILAKTKKGFGMGDAGESRMTAHQAKKLDVTALLQFRDRFSLPLTDEQVQALTYLKPDAASAEMKYLNARRESLGGFTPARSQKAPSIVAPALAEWGGFALSADNKEMSTTMGFVRMLSGLLRDAELGPRIVPIVADEARTFGMASLFRQVGIYSPKGQLYEPEDAGSMLSYREAIDGQLLEEGITEAGALSSWTAAATAYSVHGEPMLPFYIYYSIFGFQRVGDLIWAAADQRARGFLLGATAGRTTLSGEGLQHQDGASQLLATTVPNCRAYDPAFVSELAVIINHGMQRMLRDQCDEFYYLTVGNENYAQPNMPEGVEEDIINGMYRFAGYSADGNPAQPKVRLLGSGSILREVIAAAELLVADWKIVSEVFSVTSFSELARNARRVDRWNRLHPTMQAAQSHLNRLLAGGQPVVAATDYVRAVPQQVAEYLDAPFSSLGTDGFGRSDTREALRSFFEVDRYQVVIAALQALSKAGEVEPAIVASAISKYQLQTPEPPPWEC